MRARLLLLLVCAVLLCGGIVMRGSGGSIGEPTTASLHWDSNATGHINHGPDSGLLAFRTDGADWTIEGWIRGIDSGDVFRTFWRLHADGNDASYCLVFVIETNVVDQAGMYTNGSGFFFIDGQSWANDQTWHHIALVHEDVTARVDLYVDAAFAGSGFFDNTQCNQPSSHNSVSLGNRPPGSEPIDADMFLVRFWTEDRCAGATPCPNLRDHATCKVDTGATGFFEEWSLDNVTTSATGTRPMTNGDIPGAGDPPCGGNGMCWNSAQTPFDNYGASVVRGPNTLNGTGSDCL